MRFKIVSVSNSSSHPKQAEVMASGGGKGKQKGHVKGDLMVTFTGQCIVRARQAIDSLSVGVLVTNLRQ